MLWELSISNEDEDKRIIPVFVNKNFVLRPMAGKRLMDVFLDANSKLVVDYVANVTDKVYEKLEQMSAEFAYDAFVDLKDKRIQKKQERFNKYDALNCLFSGTRQFYWRVLASIWRVVPPV